MSETAKKMTPEEKLLALIQQDKRQTPVEPKPPTPAAVAPAPSPPAPTPAAAVPVAPKPAPVSAPVPAAVPVVSGPSPGTSAPGKEEAPRLKLAEPALPLVGATSAPEEMPPADKAGPMAVKAPAFVSLSTSRATGLLLLNRGLGVVVLVLIALVFYSVGAINPGIAEALERQVLGAGSLSMTPTVFPQEAPPALESYLEKVAARNVFVARAQTKSEGDAHPEATGSPKDLKLVAVSMDSSSAEESMAIIRNKADSKTYFVKLGQTVGPTDYVLDRIFSDHVVVKLQKQLFDVK